MNKQGSSLIAELRENSGLDHQFFDEQMKDVFSSYSLDAETLSLDQLRIVLADYLQNLILAEDAETSKTESA